MKLALESTDKEKQLEGTVANMLITNGYPVISFSQKYWKNPPSDGAEGEIDVETTKVIIEVTTVRSGKKPQITGYLTSNILNPLKKKVILYAPEYLDSAARDITSMGVPVLKTPAELFAKMSEIGK